MNTSFIIYYGLIFTAMTSLLFTAYRLIFRNTKNFKLQRFMLLSILGVSLLMPFNPVKISLPTVNLNIEKTISSFTERAVEVKTGMDKENGFSEPTAVSPAETVVKTNEQFWSFSALLTLIYLLASFVLIVRLLLNITKLIYWYYAFPKSKQDNCTLVQLPAGKSTCSFFNCIFINEEGLDNSEKQQIITHEKIHASQYHSLDIILIELIGAVMWFNPFMWMIKREIRLVHEYLADDEVPHSDWEKIRYQALLLNQATGGKIISFSSQFNQSIIKKRIMMMEKQRSSKKSGRRLLWFLPVVLLFVLGTAWVNGQGKNEKVKEELVFAENEEMQETPLTKLFDAKLVDKVAIIEILVRDANDKSPTEVKANSTATMRVDYTFGYADKEEAPNVSEKLTQIFNEHPNDSSKFTELLNQMQSKTNNPQKMWARFYSPKNNPKAPLLLLISSTEAAENINVKSANVADVIKEYFQLEEKGINSRISVAEMISEKRN